MPIGWIILALAFAFALIRGIWRGAVVVGLAAVLVLSIVFTFTIARIGMTGELDSQVFETYSVSVLDRAFIAPFDTGVLANRYAEDVGGLGISNIRPLALLAGVEPVNLPNIVNRTYFPHLRESGMVNTSFVFDLQASFGIWPGWWCALALLAMLDVLLYCTVACTSCCCRIHRSLHDHPHESRSSATTVLLSGGIVVPLVLLLSHSSLDRRMIPSPAAELSMAVR